MEKKYDIWVDYGYEGWDYEFGLTKIELEKTITECNYYDRMYFVYEAGSIVREKLF